MPWLRRLITSRATWANLHKLETSPYTFNPYNSNQEGLIKAKELSTNYFWKDVYASLLQCRQNIMLLYPEEAISLPINGEPQITSNKYAINQEWCRHDMLNMLLNNTGSKKNIEDFYGPKKTVSFEFLELKRTLRNFLDSSFGEERGLEDGWLVKIRQKIGTFNLYGRIVTKKAKGCSFFYELLNANAKTDGWILPELKLLTEMANFKNDLDYDNTDYMRFVKEILKMPYLNRLKQFLLRLLRNNLLLGKRAEKNKNPEESKCYICSEHKESRVMLFLGYKNVQEKTEFLKRV